MTTVSAGARRPVRLRRTFRTDVAPAATCDVLTLRSTCGDTAHRCPGLDLVACALRSIHDGRYVGVRLAAPACPSTVGALATAGFDELGPDRMVWTRPRNHLLRVGIGFVAIYTYGVLVAAIDIDGQRSSHLYDDQFVDLVDDLSEARARRTLSGLVATCSGRRILPVPRAIRMPFDAIEG